MSRQHRQLCLLARRMSLKQEVSSCSSPFRCVGQAYISHATSRASSSAASPENLVQHHHLRGASSGGLLPYDDAQAAQEERRSEFLRWKGLKDEERDRMSLDSLKPTLFSFEAEPTFTLGRRQDDLDDEQESLLTRDLRFRVKHRDDATDQVAESTLKPVVRRTQRGGLTTYHGPGQLVLWPVLDMHSYLYARFTVSSYAHCLESVTQRLLSSLYNIHHTVTSEENPGVWVADSHGKPIRKIAALGVHHRRHVTGLGIALNVDIPTQGAEEMNPWGRFEPCGLSREGVTSVEREMGVKMGERVWDLKELAGSWAKLFEDALRNEKMR